VAEQRKFSDLPAPKKPLALTQKHPTFCVRKMTTTNASTFGKIVRRIRSHGRGWVFTPTHHADLGTRNAIASALKRLKADGEIRQLARGLYDYPLHDPQLGPLAPSADAIAAALAARGAIRLQPSGDYAANKLGLSEQVPVRIVFLTDGPDKKVRLGKREIILSHTTPRNMATAGRLSGTLIQAMKYLGKNRIDDRVINILHNQIPPSQHAAIHKDLAHAPAWIAAALRPLIAIERAETPKAPRKSAEETGKGSEETAGSSEESSEKVLKAIAGNPQITAREIALTLGITPRGVEKTIAKLEFSGKIRRVGSTKSGHWDVQPEDFEHCQPL
jgi:predicted transcriptional regulator of viral defense system